MKSGYVVFFVFLLVSTIPAVDIAFSALFYDGGGFVLQNNRPVELFELSVPIALGFCGLVIFGLWLGGRLNCRVIAGVNRRVMLLTFGTLVLGPLLAINGILKSFWGRARPMEIFEFGGFKTFSPAGIISNQCSLDCSFASSVIEDFRVSQLTDAKEDFASAREESTESSCWLSDLICP